MARSSGRSSPPSPALRWSPFHRYPLRAASPIRARPSYPSIPNLLSDRVLRRPRAAVAPYVAVAHAHGLPFRVDELNSAASPLPGQPGVSDTFASGAVDARHAVQPGRASASTASTSTRCPAPRTSCSRSAQRGGGWQAFVHPDYYGLLMFAQAFPPGARLLPVARAGRPGQGVGHARAPTGTSGSSLINKDSRAHDGRAPAALGRRPASARVAAAPRRRRHQRRHARRPDVRRRDRHRAPARPPAAAAGRRRLLGVRTRSSCRRRARRCSRASRPRSRAGLRRRSCAARGTPRGPACPGSPGTASSSSREAARIASGEPKWLSSARLRAGPTPGSSSRIEAVIARSRRIRWWVIANRWASSRTRWSSWSSARVVGEAQRLGATRDEHLLDPLGQRDHDHAALAEPLQRAQPGRQLALAAVDHDHVGQRGEARVVVLVVRGDVALALPAARAGATSTSSIAAKSSGSPIAGRAVRREVADGTP